MEETLESVDEGKIEKTHELQKKGIGFTTKGKEID